MKKLRKSKNSMIGGVCASFAQYLSQSSDECDADTPIPYEVDPDFVRISFIIFTIVTGGIVGILAYLIIWLYLSRKNLDAKNEVLTTEYDQKHCATCNCFPDKTETSVEKPPKSSFDLTDYLLGGVAKLLFLLIVGIIIYAIILIINTI